MPRKGVRAVAVHGAAAMYLLGILLAFVAPWVSCLFYATVAAIWFISDRRIESRIKQ
ncbi:hypothetical protein ACO2Q2_06030 [Dyella sp. KRB-257]|uniref:hypothetical protein n=1 Tax=Dyella sp. KRB-257 TaxID=3400915 RepID=UPI003C0195E8